MLILIGRRGFRATSSPLREGDVRGANPKLLYSEDSQDRTEKNSKTERKEHSQSGETSYDKTFSHQHLHVKSLVNTKILFFLKSLKAKF